MEGFGGFFTLTDSNFEETVKLHMGFALRLIENVRFIIVFIVFACDG